jgi:hypothetical protein
MRKSCSTWLITAALVSLLNLGPSPSGAYYPPLQATATYTSHSLTYKVFNPQTAKEEGSTLLYMSGTIVNLQQHNGVIAWVVQDGTSYSVKMYTFDPALNKFKYASQGPFTSVTQLQVMDGVVAFVAREISQTHSDFFYSTYDPAKEAWQNQSCVVDDYSPLNYQIINKDGVLVFHYTRQVVPYLPRDIIIEADIYDPVQGQWFSEFSGYKQEVIYNDSLAIDKLRIANATIYFEEIIPVNDPIQYTAGYDLSQHKWDFWDSVSGGTPVTTKAGAYFVAQPSSGSSPLWVWFTDMSIAGTSWNWQFGDGSTSTNRSPYHTFTSLGNFQVSQQISGPNGNDTYNKTISVGSGVPAIMHLLLLND